MGDFGLLAYKLLDEMPEKKYDIGICPHYGFKNHPIFQKLLKEIPNSIFLDTEEDIFEFMKKLAACKTILSTGMHPLIAADSLGIPNVWATVLGFENTYTRFKTLDYYSALGVENSKPLDLRYEKVDVEYIIKNYKVERKKVLEVQQNIFNAVQNAINTILNN